MLSGTASPAMFCMQVGIIAIAQQQTNLFFNSASKLKIKRDALLLEYVERMHKLQLCKIFNCISMLASVSGAMQSVPKVV